MTVLEAVVLNIDVRLLFQENWALCVVINCDCELSCVRVCVCVCVCMCAHGWVSVECDIIVCVYFVSQ